MGSTKLKWHKFEDEAIALSTALSLCFLK